MTEGAAEEKGKERRRRRIKRSKKKQAEKKENGRGACVMRTEFWSEREKPAHKNHQVDQAQETRAVEDLAEEGGKYRKTRIEKKHKEVFSKFLSAKFFTKLLGGPRAPRFYRLCSKGLNK